MLPLCSDCHSPHSYPPLADVRDEGLLANFSSLTHNLRGVVIGGSMNAFAIRMERLAGVILTIVVGAWPAAGWSYTAEQQQACMGDAFRLCSFEIPDVSRVAACMAKRQTELSPGCRVYFRQEESTARPRRHRIRQYTASDE